MTGTVWFRHRNGGRCYHDRPGRTPCPGGSGSYVRWRHFTIEALTVGFRARLHRHRPGQRKALK